MKVISKGHGIGKRGQKFRIRKFKCLVCDHEESVYADGSIDEYHEPIAVKKQIGAIYKREQKARE